MAVTGGPRHVLPLWLALAAGIARAEDVTWILPEFPPGFINDPGMAGEGYGDKQLKFLIGHLPQFHHVILDGTANRVWHEMEHRDGICTLTVAKLPEREKLAVFSARSFWATTNQVIVRTDRLAEFARFRDKSGAIDLARLAADDHLRGAYSDSTSYGPSIDAFIHDPARKTPLEITAHLRMPLTLLDKERIDFAFGYYMEMSYFRRLDHLEDHFTALPTQPEPARQDGHVACSNKTLGREVIAAIDSLLASAEGMKAYIEPLRAWYSPADFDAAEKAAKSAKSNK